MLKPILHTLYILLLTALTQIGGLVYLLCIPLLSYLKPRLKVNKLARILVNTLVCVLVYMVITVTLVPAFAKIGGRVPLPRNYQADFPLEPANKLNCWLNRHYVTPKMHATIQAVAKDVQQKYPNVKLQYLDANFPFINGFPLPPHLSHNDGRKLDISFLYKDQKTGKALNGKRISLTGYGVCEEAQKGEQDQAVACAKQGFWQYSIMKKITLQNRKGMTLDESRTADLMRILSRDKNVKRLFLEPHLKKRLGLSNDAKVRFHGCHAVRHDDHIHIEVR